MPVTISDLDPAAAAYPSAAIPFMYGGSTKRCTPQQIIDLVIAGATEGFDTLEKIEGQIIALVGAAPPDLDTLEKIANATPGLASVNTFTKTQVWSKGADVASAAALTLGDDGNYFDVTGTTTVTSIATVGVGTVIKLHFDGALTLTHHSTDLVLPYGVDVSTYAGLELEFVEYDVGKWRCTSHLQPPIFHVRDQKTTGTQGGSSVAGDQVRALNAVVTNGITGASLTSNKITLPVGVYDVGVNAPAFRVSRHKIWIRDASSLSVLLEGSNAFSTDTTDTAMTRSEIAGRLTLSSATELEIVHFTSSVNASLGLGVATNKSGRPEIYTEALFRKVA